MKRKKNKLGLLYFSGVACLSLIATNISFCNSAHAQAQKPEAATSTPEVIDEIRFDGSTKLEPQGSNPKNSSGQQGFSNGTPQWRGGMGGGKVPYIRGVGPTVLLGGQGAASLLQQVPGPQNQSHNNSFTPHPAHGQPLGHAPAAAQEDSIGGIGGIPGPDSPEGQAVTAESNSPNSGAAANPMDPAALLGGMGAAGGGGAGGLDPSMIMNMGALMMGAGGAGGGGLPGLPGGGGGFPSLPGSNTDNPLGGAGGLAKPFGGGGAAGGGGGSPDITQLMQQLGGGGAGNNAMDPASMIKNMQQLQNYSNALTGGNSDSIPDPSGSQ